MSSSSDVGNGMVDSSSAIVAQTVKGLHVPRIDGYSRTKRLGNCEFIKSDTFDIGGHLWYIRYYLDGADTDGAGWIEFYLHLSRHNDTGVNASYKFSLLDDVGEPVPSYCISDDVIPALTMQTSDGDIYNSLRRRPRSDQPI
jgi:speckle-type POZ protein